MVTSDYRKYIISLYLILEIPDLSPVSGSCLCLAGWTEVSDPPYYFSSSGVVVLRHLQLKALGCLSIRAKEPRVTLIVAYMTSIKMPSQDWTTSTSYEKWRLVISTCMLHVAVLIEFLSGDRYYLTVGMSCGNLLYLLVWHFFAGLACWTGYPSIWALISGRRFGREI